MKTMATAATMTAEPDVLTLLPLNPLMQMNGAKMINWQLHSAVATVAEATDWATVYFVASKRPKLGHCTALMAALKEHYAAKGLRFGCTIAITPAMRHILRKLSIKEYNGKD